MTAVASKAVACLAGGGGAAASGAAGSRWQLLVIRVHYERDTSVTQTQVEAGASVSRKLANRHKGAAYWPWRPRGSRFESAVGKETVSS